MKKDRYHFYNYRGKEIKPFNNRGIWTFCIIIIIFTVMMIVFGEWEPGFDIWQGFR